MSTYVAIWVVAFIISVAVFVIAAVAGVAFIPSGRFMWWGIAYPVMVGSIGLDMVRSYDGRQVLPIDFAIPVVLTVLGAVLMFAVLAYARNPGE